MSIEIYRWLQDYEGHHHGHNHTEHVIQEDEDDADVVPIIYKILAVAWMLFMALVCYKADQREQEEGTRRRERRSRRRQQRINAIKFAPGRRQAVVSAALVTRVSSFCIDRNESRLIWFEIVLRSYFTFQFSWFFLSKSKCRKWRIVKRRESCWRTKVILLSKRTTRTWHVLSALTLLRSEKSSLSRVISSVTTAFIVIGKLKKSNRRNWNFDNFTFLSCLTLCVPIIHDPLSMTNQLWCLRTA